MVPIDKLEFFFTLLFIIVSAFLTLIETSLISLNKIKFRHIMHDKNKKEFKSINNLIDKSNEFLSITVICNHILNISMSISASLFFLTHLNNIFSSVIFVIITVLIYLLFGQIIPKIIASKNPEKTLYILAPYVGGIVFILKPIMHIFGFIINIFFKIFKIKKKEELSIIEDELLTAIDIIHEEGVIETRDKKIIKNILNFSDVKAKDIMTRRVDVISINIDSNFEDIIRLFKDECYSRIPVYKNSEDNIVGVINLKDIVFLDDKEKENFKIENFLRKVTITYEHKDIAPIFDDMKLNKTHMCIVVNEYGGFLGILTIEDLIEAIIGDINDEYDECIDFEKISDNNYIIDASMSIYRFNEIFNLNIISNDCDSIGGYIIYQLNKIPKLGEEILIANNINLIIEEIDKYKLIKLKVVIN